MQTYDCPKCGGSGKIPFFNRVMGGVCFSCGGSGKKNGKKPNESPKWAVFGLEHSTGKMVRMYNVKAKNEFAAIEKARGIFSGASAQFKNDHSLSSAIALEFGKSANKIYLED